MKHARESLKAVAKLEKRKKAAMNNVLKARKPISVLAGDGKIFDYLKYFLPQFIKNREKLKIPAKIIFDEPVRERKPELPLSEIKYAPEKFSSPISITVYGSSVNLLIFAENPIAIHMEGKEIAQSFMNYFSLMWKMARK